VRGEVKAAQDSVQGRSPYEPKRNTGRGAFQSRISLRFIRATVAVLISARQIAHLIQCNECPNKDRQPRDQ
jgi:hypothetical protein